MPVNDEGLEYHEHNGIPVWPFALVSDYASDNPNYRWWAKTVLPDHPTDVVRASAHSEDEVVQVLAHNVGRLRAYMTGRTARVVKVTAG